VAPETLVRVCAALGAPVALPGDAVEALRVHRASRNTGLVPPVLVAWDGILPLISSKGSVETELRLENGDVVPLETRPLPFGYHRLTIESSGRVEASTVIAAPEHAWRRPGPDRSWGVCSHLAALRSVRSRSLGDLRDLELLCRWVRERGGDLVTVLPLLPTFNAELPEPSPYSPVSRLFWSELILDLEAAHRPTRIATTLDVTKADAEVRAALAGHPVPAPSSPDEELARYARFRGAQARLGRNWRAWPPEARAGALTPDHVDAEEARFHLVAQTLVRQQLHDLKQRLEGDGMRLGLDLAVGVQGIGICFAPQRTGRLAGGPPGSPARASGRAPGPVRSAARVVAPPSGGRRRPRGTPRARQRPPSQGPGTTGEGNRPRSEWVSVVGAVAGSVTGGVRPQRGPGGRGSG